MNTSLEFDRFYVQWGPGLHLVKDIKEKNDYPFVTNIHLVSPDRNFIWLIFDFISSFKYLYISSLLLQPTWVRVSW